MSKPLIRAGLAVLLLASLAACGDAASGSSTTAPITIPPTAFKTIPTVPESTTTTAPPGPTQPPAAGDTTTAITDYKLRPNDTPGKVAKLYSISKEQLDAANAATPDYAKFLVGMTIKIPVGAIIPQATSTGTTVLDSATEASTATAGSTADSTASSAGGSSPSTSSTPLKSNCAPGNYTLVKNDTPTKVAKKFGISVEQLAAANENTKGYKSFVVGTKISIPTFNC